MRAGTVAKRRGGFQTNLLHGLDDLCVKFLGNEQKLDLLEIGFGRGISTELFCYYAKSVTSLDIVTHKNVNMLLNKYKNFAFHNISSTKFLSTCPRDTFDMIYIDGSHEYNDVLNDIMYSVPCLVDNGILAGHDMFNLPNWKGGGPNDVTLAVYDCFPGLITGEDVLHRFSDSSWAVQVRKQKKHQPGG